MRALLHGGYQISDDKARLDVAAIHRYISEESYWAPGRPRDVVERCIAHSLCLGAYAPDGDQAGFLRVVSDYAVMAHLNDVFVLPAHRGRGLGAALVAAALAHPALAGVPSWTLRTRDAHGLYARFGFAVADKPQNMMVRRVAPPDSAPAPVDAPPRTA